MTAAKKFDLGIYVFPGGTVYANRAVTENGDYKTVAFIDKEGVLSFRVPVEYIPGPALLRIEHDADATRKNWLAWYHKKTDIQKYYFLMDRATIQQFLDVPRDAELSEKIKFLEREQGII